MQISRVVLVYDVKINQLGRKNLAVRFDLDQARGFPIIARKSGGRVRLYIAVPAMTSRVAFR
jgi:hypothetical protein